MENFVSSPFLNKLAKIERKFKAGNFQSLRKLRDFKDTFIMFRSLCDKYAPWTDCVTIIPHRLFFLEQLKQNFDSHKRKIVKLYT